MIASATTEAWYRPEPSGNQPRGTEIVVLPGRIAITEVGPRDGLQGEETLVPMADKVRLIDLLAETGLRHIEATSFVNPKVIPQLADAAQVMSLIKRPAGVRYAGLAFNRRGAEQAVASKVDAIASAVSAGDRHSLYNVRRTVQEALALVEEVLQVADSVGLPGAVTIATAFGCPYGSAVTPEGVVQLARTLYGMGVRELGLGDTTGMATPLDVERLVGTMQDAFPDISISLHLHDTRGTAMANAYAGLRAGVTQFDTAVGGLGMSRYTRGLAGNNLATEDFVHRAQEMGIETGVDLDALLLCAEQAQQLVKRPLPSYLLKAGKRTDSVPLPASVGG
jgi:hydroxymethylglutaryl-CoA lyase